MDASGLAVEPPLAEGLGPAERLGPVAGETPTDTKPAVDQPPGEALLPLVAMAHLQAVEETKTQAGVATPDA